MSNMEFLAKALSIHTKGKDAAFLKEAKDYNKDGKIDDHEKDHDKEEDRFKKIEKDVKSLKKEETEVSEESLTEAEEAALEILEKLGTVYDEAIHLQGLLEHLGYDLEDLFAIEEDADEEMQEGFANVSKAKRLIAQRKAAMMRRLRQGARPASKKPGMPRR